MKVLTPHRIFVLNLLSGIGLVAGGLYLAQTLNLAACPLCILQRMLYLALALAALVGLLLPRCRLSQILVALGSVIIAGTGAFVAGYQVWLQRFAADASCTANSPWWEGFVYWAGEKVPLLFNATGLCSEAGWKFLGLSIADWSLLIFSGLTVLALIALRQTLARHR
ncbi:MAG TPA: disulfide bond formation protein B [Rhodocyclaceae bacterium]|nr:disulfide bond formation protein B [Rhodocyclaceae bacterium]